MNPYRNLTDDQLAEWHMQDVQINRLKNDLATVTQQLNDAIRAHRMLEADRDEVARLGAAAVVEAQTEATALRRARDQIRERYLTLALVARDVFAMWLFAYRKGLIRSSKAEPNEFAVQVESLLNGLIEEVP